MPNAWELLRNLPDSKCLVCRSGDSSDGWLQSGDFFKAQNWLHRLRHVWAEQIPKLVGVILWGIWGMWKRFWIKVLLFQLSPPKSLTFGRTLGDNFRDRCGRQVKDKSREEWAGKPVGSPSHQEEECTDTIFCEQDGPRDRHERAGGRQGDAAIRVNRSRMAHTVSAYLKIIYFFPGYS